MSLRHFWAPKQERAPKPLRLLWLEPDFGADNEDSAQNWGYLMGAGHID